MQISKNILIFSISILALLIFYFQFKYDVSKSYLAIHSTDYPNYYFAGKSLLSRKTIYKPIQSDVKNLLNWDNYLAYSADTPITNIVLSPLSLLSIHDGAWLLNFISIILTCLSIFLISKVLGCKLLTCLFFTTLAISSVPFLFLLKKFHMESLVLFLGSLGFIALKKSHFRSCGVLWGIAAALKIFPILWLVPFFINKDKPRVFYFGLATAAGLTFISFALVGSMDTKAFIFEIIPKSKLWYGAAGNYSLISFFSALCGLDTGKYAALFSIILVLILFFKNSKGASDEKRFTLATSAALLISPLAWMNYFILFFPSLIFLANKYSYINFKSYFPLLILFAVIWAWPDYIWAKWYFLSVLLSFMPMFAMLAVLTYYHKKL